jgi:hypothetical protein
LWDASAPARWRGGGLGDAGEHRSRRPRSRPVDHPARPGPRSPVAEPVGVGRGKRKRRRDRVAAGSAIRRPAAVTPPQRRAGRDGPPGPDRADGVSRRRRCARCPRA